MAAQRGFCPYCAYVNPPDHKFCISCQKKLPEYPVPASNAGGSVDDGVPVEPEEPPPPKSARWVILVLTVGLAIIVLVAGVGILTHVLASSNGSSGSGRSTVRTDVCDPSAGVNCKGNHISLPYEANQLLQNVSTCALIIPQGGPPHMILNFTTTSKVYGALIPESFYKGAGASYSADPAGFYNNSSAVSQSAWSSAAVFGGALVNVQVPSTSATWCLVWWDPGPMVTITLTADVYLDYN
jgi:hypothetical protein